MQTALPQYVFAPFTAFTFFPQSHYPSQIQGETPAETILTGHEHGSCEASTCLLAATGTVHGKAERPFTLYRR